ncbi:hypothetical protein MSG28_006057 [Choristoneura fumiferana]|uniref:Uncharacterized protein n=1 Tax=Choristoneura fumiferana TaxID=7141 RepID=A0ACC0JDK1_CHOFU|nr:hypothetical protein MSG28_006057 [Choristoneura fumiferana]
MLCLVSRRVGEETCSMVPFTDSHSVALGYLLLADAVCVTATLARSDLARALERLLRAHVSPALVRDQLQAVAAAALPDAEVTVHPSTNEVVCTFVVEERPMELSVSLGAAHPLAPPRVAAAAPAPAPNTHWLAVYLAYQISARPITRCRDLVAEGEVQVAVHDGEPTHGGAQALEASARPPAPAPPPPAAPAQREQCECRQPHPARSGSGLRLTRAPRPAPVSNPARAARPEAAIMRRPRARGRRAHASLCKRHYPAPAAPTDLPTAAGCDRGTRPPACDTRPPWEATGSP